MLEQALVYMAGGISSRYGGSIKALARVGPNSETLIAYSIKEALAGSHFTKIVCIVGEVTRQPIQSLLGSRIHNLPVVYATQTYDGSNRDKPWGTVDALCAAREHLNCSFVVCNSDNLYGKTSFNLLSEHLATRVGGATIGYPLYDNLPREGEANRGIIRVDAHGNVKSIQENLGISRENLASRGLRSDDSCSMNIFALPATVVPELVKRLEAFKLLYAGDRKKECYLPEELSSIIAKGKLVMGLYPAREIVLDVTVPGDEKRVQEILRERTKV